MEGSCAMGPTCVREMQEVYATSDMVEEFTVYSVEGVGVL
jgi:hypothetical protein